MPNPRNPTGRFKAVKAHTHRQPDLEATARILDIMRKELNIHTSWKNTAPPLVAEINSMLKEGPTVSRIHFVAEKIKHTVEQNNFKIHSQLVDAKEKERLVYETNSARTALVLLSAALKNLGEVGHNIHHIKEPISSSVSFSSHELRERFEKGWERHLELIEKLRKTKFDRRNDVTEFAAEMNQSKNRSGLAPEEIEALTEFQKVLDGKQPRISTQNLIVLEKLQIKYHILEAIRNNPNRQH